MGADTTNTTLKSARAPCLCDDSVRRPLKTQSLWARDGSGDLGMGSVGAQEETEELIP